ncbi:MAG: hypothetical protein KAI53_02235 [Candidatus Aenigmarchaeota archaeon]|nr:hypothetical protein [Candidatus Aenigmarchaeota archaeon]
MKRNISLLGKTVPTLVVALMLFSGIGFAALLTNYGIITGTAEVDQSVLVDGEGYEDSLTLTYTIDPAVGGNTYMDEPHTLKDRADVPAYIAVGTTYGGPSWDGITTRYVGMATLTKKTVDFGSEVWDVPIGAETVDIEYTLIGDSFEAEVVSNAQENYVLIYYKDNSDRFNSPADAIYVADVTGNLPYSTDGNVDEYDYCATGEYTTCHGAKLWYVPAGAVNNDGSIDWSQASAFFFETELIQYNQEGELTLYPQHVLNFGIENTFDIASIPGSHTITTKIAVGGI